MSSYQNLRKLVSAAGVEGVENLTDKVVLGIAKGLRIKPTFTAKAGETNKNPRPGVLYVSGPGLTGSDGKPCKGAYIEVGALRPMIDQLVAIEDSLREGTTDLPPGYQVEFSEEGHALRALGGLEDWEEPGPESDETSGA